MLSSAIATGVAALIGVATGHLMTKRSLDSNLLRRDDPAFTSLIQGEVVQQGFDAMAQQVASLNQIVNVNRQEIAKLSALANQQRQQPVQQVQTPGNEVLAAQLQELRASIGFPQAKQ